MKLTAAFTKAIDDVQGRGVIDKPLVSVVVPAYNEAERIGDSLSQILDLKKRLNQDWEILVVDDGSVDQTREVVQSIGEEVKLLINERNMGKGFSVRRGMLAATGNILLFSDADLSTPISEIKKFWNLIHNKGG